MNRRKFLLRGLIGAGVALLANDSKAVELHPINGTVPATLDVNIPGIGSFTLPYLGYKASTGYRWGKSVSVPFGGVTCDYVNVSYSGPTPATMLVDATASIIPLRQYQASPGPDASSWSVTATGTFHAGTATVTA
jgi:hypothetical protein